MGNKKKMKWYLSRGLGTFVDDVSIKLNFTPKGRFGHGLDEMPSPEEFAVRSMEEEFSTAEKENRCAVCGHTLHYLRFHLVPSTFRSVMPSNFQPGSHDVLLLCTPCHEEAAKRHTNVITGKLALH